MTYGGNRYIYTYLHLAPAEMCGASEGGDAHQEQMRQGKEGLDMERVDGEKVYTQVTTMIRIKGAQRPLGATRKRRPRHEQS